MPAFSDDTLIDKLKKEESASFGLLYKLYFPTIASFIKQNSGSHQDAEDIFQETVIVLLNKVRQPEFVLTSSLKTYLFSISRNCWLKRLRDNKPAVVLTDDHTLLETPEDLLQEENTNNEKVVTWLKKITIHCQRILKAIFYLNEPIDNLMIKMGWRNKHTATNQKYKCIEQLRKEGKK
ncbi:RNA polymerase sigma factor [Niastella sp. OAS944]|uniref:RNA polymerase sigma factor n=1 Tax=Niastella sp. OAS944 TaxID=2664089 RepID=UPI00346E2599|nr:RNA polymerase sigma factor (sigma-70 family) [Chitinophagaceae bacterium OAS944]